MISSAEEAQAWLDAFRCRIAALQEGICALMDARVIRLVDDWIEETGAPYFFWLGADALPPPLPVISYA